jgi:hypothetical protein
VLLLAGCCEGEGLRASSGDNHNNSRPWGGKGTLLYTLACMVNSRPGLGPTPNVNREKKKKKKKKKKLVVLPKLGCLASYIGYVPRVSTYPC